MSKTETQKLKTYHLYKIMLEKTDDEHSLTMDEIIKELEKRGVTAERKSIYRDFAVMNDEMDTEIIGEKIGKNFYYHISNKTFELAELKLLVDSVQSSKFITERKSANLIKKITSLGSIYEAGQLKRQVRVQGRIKTMNESIFYNVDKLHAAIEANKRIQFYYMQWNAEKKLVPKVNEEGEIKRYEVSPWALAWDDENYYLVAFDHFTKGIRHYRVDKMNQIELSEEKREGKAEFKDFDPAMYAKENFGMFREEEENVRIEFPEHFIGVFIDRFGKDIPIHKADRKGYYKTTVRVFVSGQFLGWIFGLGPEVTIAGPDTVVERYQSLLSKNLERYKK